MSLELANAKIMSNAFSKSILSDLLKTGKSKKFDLIISSISNLEIKDKTHGELFDLLHLNMIKNYRNEYIYKNAIANKIVLGRHKFKNISFFTELFVWGVIADVVVANGTTTAYEIKTAYDSFSRLNNQIGIYKQAFEYVNIVIPESKLSSLIKIAPDNVGIIILSENFTFQEYRKPISNEETLSTEIMLSLLHASDKKYVLKKYFNKELEYKSINDFYNEEKYLLELDSATMHKELLSSMHKRQYDQQRKDLVLKSPESLRSILISANYSRPKMKSISNFLEQIYN